MRNLLRRLLGAETCPGCAVRDAWLRDKDATIANLQKQIADLQNKVMALADTHAAATAARISSTPLPVKPEERKTRLPIPAWAGQLIGGGNVNMAKLRGLANPKPKTQVPEPVK